MAAPALAWWDVQTGGQDAQAPLVAVSDTGYARGECWDPLGGLCLSGQEGFVAASGTGTATGGIAVSATGNATATSPGWGIPAVAVSGTGCSTAGTDYGADSVAVSGMGCSTATNTNGSHTVAVSGGGCATATKESYWFGFGTAVSPTCTASGNIALSGTGNAYGGPDNRTWVPSTSLPVPGLAASGTGEAHGGAVSVAGGDATAYGGLLCVSATGDCRGASVYNVCPMGYCE